MWVKAITHQGRKLAQMFLRRKNLTCTTYAAVTTNQKIVSARFAYQHRRIHLVGKKPLKLHGHLPPPMLFRTTVKELRQIKMVDGGRFASRPPLTWRQCCAYLVVYGLLPFSVQTKEMNKETESHATVTPLPNVSKMWYFGPERRFSSSRLERTWD